MNSNPQLQKQIESIVREVIDSIIPQNRQFSIPIEISARHMHITQEDLEVLFGKGAKLTKLRDLLQPGEFAANETVAIIGPNRRMFQSVRILGPCRKFTQLEMSFTDGRFLGIDLPARVSGNIENSAPIVMVGPKGILNLDQGAIRAMRHIHMSFEDAAKLGLKNGQNVSVKTGGPNGVTFDNVLMRAGEGLKPVMHIDTDEANSAGLSGDVIFGEIIP